MLLNDTTGYMFVLLMHLILICYLVYRTCVLFHH